MTTTDKSKKMRDTAAMQNGTQQYLNAAGTTDLLTAEEEVGLAQAIERGEEAQQRLDADDTLDASETVTLRRTVRRGIKAREEFIEANLRLVVSIARRYIGRGMDLDDLIQEGNIGLIRAVEKFNWRRGFKFSTYATWWIMQAVTRAIANKSRLVRVPVHMHDALTAINAAREKVRAQLQREPTTEEIAEEAGLSPEDVARALRVSHETNAVSLARPVGEDGAVLGDFIADNSETPFDERLADAAERVAMLAEVLPSFSEREFEILSLRFGIDEGVPRTLDEIGEMFGVTRERIRQIEHEALEKAHRKLRAPAAHLET